MKLTYRGKKVGRPFVLKPKKCGGCKKEFQPHLSTTKFCSRDCAKNNRAKKGKEIACKSCSKNFYVRPGGTNIKYCSMKCMGESKKNSVAFKCKNCLARFERPVSQVYWRGKGRYCSVACRVADKRKKPTIRSMDTLWALIIKARAGNKCEYCGKKEGLNSHHLFSRSNMATRWYIPNGVSVCVSHHVWGNFSAHKSPIEFVEWIKTQRSEEWYKDLRAKANEIYRKDYAKIKAELLEEAERLNIKM